MLKKLFFTLLISNSLFAANNYSYNQINSATDFIVKKSINDLNCDKILTNENYFTTCYDYDLKSSIYAYTKLYKENINSKNIKKRPRFYDDLNLPKKFRTKYSDYTKTGFDRGHGIVSDSSWDWSLKSQKMTYIMSQIYPQYPNTNRKSYLKIEKYERQITSKLGDLEIFLKVEYPNSPKRIGRSQLAVPKGFYKKLWNKEKGFSKCFYIPNDNKSYDIRDMNTSCDNIK